MTARARDWMLAVGILIWISESPVQHKATGSQNRGIGGITMKSYLLGAVCATMFTLFASSTDAVILEPNDIVVADQGGILFRVDPNTGDRTVISSSTVGSGVSFSSPIDVSIEPDGNILVTGSGGILLRVDPASGNRTVVSSSTGVGTGPSISLFHSTVVQSDGTILVAGTWEKAVFSVDPNTGDRTEISSSTVGAGPVFGPSFLVFGESNNELFSTTNGTGEIYRVDVSSGNRTLVSSTAKGTGPSLGYLFDITLTPDGTILAANGGGLGSSPAIFEIDPATGNRTTVSSNALGIGLGPDFGRPQGVAFQGDGSIVVSDGLLGSLFSVDFATGNRLDLSSSTVGSGVAFIEPLGLAIVPAGSVPEPATLALMSLGLAGIGYQRLRSKKAA